MRQVTNMHSTDVTKLLQNLVSRGILTHDGQGRWTKYSLHKGSYSLHMDDYSLHKGNYSLHKGESEKLEDELISIAQLAKLNKRLSPKSMESIILRLCQNRWLTRKEISHLVQRNPEGLRARFLALMVEHGLLQLRYPDNPNRIDQAYRVKGEKNQE